MKIPQREKTSHTLFPSEEQMPCRCCALPQGRNFLNYSYLLIGSVLLRADFPGVEFHLFHIPEKGEVFSGHYWLNVEDDMKKIGLEYIPLLQTCTWKTSMYHKHDAHPNDNGYYNLAKCMTKYIE